MKTTRFEVKYHPCSVPRGTRVMSTSLGTLPLFMTVDATCAKDAVEVVLAAHPDASIIAVLEKCPVCEKKDET